MNIVMMSRVMELTEKQTRFQRVRILMSNWKSVAIVVIIFLTAKVAAEQLAMALR